MDWAWTLPAKPALSATHRPRTRTGAQKWIVFMWVVFSVELRWAIGPLPGQEGHCGGLRPSSNGMAGGVESCRWISHDTPGQGGPPICGTGKVSLLARRAIDGLHGARSRGTRMSGSKTERAFAVC